MKRKSVIKRLSTIALSVVVVITGGIILPESRTAQAATTLKPIYEKSDKFDNYNAFFYRDDNARKYLRARVLKKTTTLMLFPKSFKDSNAISKYKKRYEVVIKQLPEKITKIKVSKKSVASLKKMKASEYKDFKGYKGVKGLMVLTPKKAGTTAVTITVKKNGKKKTYKFKIKVKKYANPLKSLKINKKSLTKKEKSKKPFSDYRFTVALGTAKTAKANIGVKKGYKIESVRYFSFKETGDFIPAEMYAQWTKNKKAVTRVIPTSTVKAYVKKEHFIGGAEWYWITPECFEICIQKKDLYNRPWGEEYRWDQRVFLK